MLFSVKIVEDYWARNTLDKNTPIRPDERILHLYRGDIVNVYGICVYGFVVFKPGTECFFLIPIDICVPAK